jgi:Tol biopolymer transport system component
MSPGSPHPWWGRAATKVFGCGTWRVRARLSTGDGLTDTPVWSADGRTLYFGSSDLSTNREEIRQVPADGSQPDRTLIKTGPEVSPADCTSDGKWLLYEETRNDSRELATLKAFPLLDGLQFTPRKTFPEATRG